jgi:two-component system, NarL family, nitrate/nitrite response regulator NarL
MESKSVVLIDRNQLFREGLKRLLDPRRHPVVGEARTLGEAEVAMIRDCRPGLVVFDIEGLDADACGDRLAEIREHCPDIRVIILTDDGSRATFMAALSLAVDAYLFKDMSADALIRSFEVVALGQQIFPSALIMSRACTGDGAAVPLVNYFAAALAPRAPAEEAIAARLTDCEMDILRALVQGHSNKKIARELSLSEGHVKVYLKTLLRKVRAKNRTQAAVWALHNGVDQAAAG